MPRPNDRTPRRRSRIRTAAAFVIVLVGFALPPTVLAHAELVASSPAEGEVVTGPLDEVVLSFDEGLVDGSTFSVLDTSGTTIATGLPDPADDTRMRAAMPAVGGGRFTVQWTSVAADGDVERGTFAFDVAVAAPPRETPSASPTIAPSAPPGPTEPASPAPTPAPALVPIDDPGGGAGIATLLPIVIVGILIGGLALLLRRRGPA